MSMALMGIFILLAVFFIIILVCLSVYKYIRPFYPVKVNCWFCSADTVVPYGNKNCWDCPACLQYNGFNKDGHYNKPIPTQYDGDLNHPVSCVQSDFISKNDVLCEKCSRNQLLKTKQLAAFVPMNEANFDAEVAAFERYLEKLYRLCAECQAEVNQELSKQDDILQQKLENFYTECPPISPEVSQIQIPEKPVHWRLVIGRIMEAVSTVCGLFLLLSSVSHFTDLLEDSEYHRYAEAFLVSFKEHGQPIGIIGLVTSIVGKIAIGKDRLCLPDVLQIPLWLTTLFIQQGSNSIPILSRAEPLVLLCNFTASSFCLLMRRKSRTSPSINIRRLSLDVSKSSSCLSDTSKGSVLYSASQVGDNQEGEIIVEEEEPENLDDTLSELEAVSLGLPESRVHKNSGLFTSSFTSSSQTLSNFSSSSTAQALREKRPLISPAKLGSSMQQRCSTPTKFQVTTARNSFAVNRSPCLQPKSAHLFLPHSLQNGSPNGSTLSTASASFTVPRLYSNSARKLQLPQCEDSEKHSDKSEGSKQTSVCLVDSTTKHTAGFSIGGFLNSPGFVGFVLGASMIGNVALACYVLRIS